MLYGRSIIEHLGVDILRLSEEMNEALGDCQEFAKMSLTDELQMADQNEALRLIASAYREGLIEENEHTYFLIRSNGREYKISNTSQAIRLRYRYPPRRLVEIISVENEKEITLNGVDGTLIALRPYFEKRQSAPTLDTWSRLLKASHQSVRNEAIASAYKKVWDKGLAFEIVASGEIFSYLNEVDVNTYTFFNQLAAFGARPVTPFSKMKLDMSAKEILSFSPEFSQRVVITFAALKKSKAKVYYTKDQPDFFTAFVQHFPDVLADWSRQLESMSYNPDDYYPIPLHPLNRTWAKDYLPEYLENDDFALVDGVAATSVPTLSFRSMLVNDICLKLPVPVQTTHMIRNIPISEIELGPMFSDIFQNIIEIEGLQDKLVLERDLFGAYLDWEGIGCSKDFAAMFCFVARQNPNSQISQGEHVVPIAGVLLKAPGESKPFLFSLMCKDGLVSEEQQYDYFADYVRTVVGTQLDLYFRTGLMLEAHQQNLNLVYSQNWQLLRLMYHDIPGGVAAFVPLLRSRHNVPEKLTVGIYYFRDSPDRSVLQFVHPTLTAHLMPLAYYASVYLGLNRSKLHEIIKREIQHQVALGRSIDSYSDEETVARNILIDKFEEIVLQSETLPTKRMLERFYLQSMIDGWGTTVPNPEVLSARILVPPSEAQNTLVIMPHDKTYPEEDIQSLDPGTW